MTRSIGIGLLLTTLAALAGVAPAQATPVCGLKSAKTLAAGAQARVYVRGDRAFACVRGHAAARAVGERERVLDASVSGRRAAVVRRTPAGQLLAVYTLGARVRTQVANVRGTIEDVRLSSSGRAVFVARPNSGAPYIGASRGGPVASALDVLSGSLNFTGGVVAWRAPDGIHLRQMYNGDLKVRRIARIGSLELAARGNGVSGSDLLLNSQGGTPQLIGSVRRECPSPQGCAGVDLVQIAGDFGAVRTIETGPDHNSLTVMVYNPASGTSREGCRLPLPNPARLGSFQLAPDGSVTCTPAG